MRVAAEEAPVERLQQVTLENITAFAAGKPVTTSGRSRRASGSGNTFFQV